MTDAPRLRSVELDHLERDVQTALHRQQIGSTIEHVNEKDIGRLSAEAVSKEYEAAAKAVETMGEEIKARVAKLEAALVEADESLKYLVETAAAITERGKLVHIQITDASSVCSDIRKACAEIRKKVGA